MQYKQYIKTVDETIWQFRELGHSDYIIYYGCAWFCRVGFALKKTQIQQDATSQNYYIKNNLKSLRGKMPKKRRKRVEFTATKMVPKKVKVSFLAKPKKKKKK